MSSRPAAAGKNKRRSLSRESRHSRRHHTAEGRRVVDVLRGGATEAACSPLHSSLHVRVRAEGFFRAAPSAQAQTMGRTRTDGRKEGGQDAHPDAARMHAHAERERERERERETELAMAIALVFGCRGTWSGGGSEP